MDIVRVEHVEACRRGWTRGEKAPLMRLIFGVLLASICVGCASNYPRELVRTKYGCEISHMGLWDTTKSENRPELKKAYPHGNNKLLRVFQSLENGVLVKAEMSFWEKENFKSGQLPEGKLNIFVETSDQYVDGEYLQAGLYEYKGIYTYTTTQNARATVRKFKRLVIGVEEDQ